MHAVFNKSTLINAFFSRSNKELIKRKLRSLVSKNRIEIISFRQDFEKIFQTKLPQKSMQISVFKRIAI